MDVAPQVVAAIIAAAGAVLAAVATVVYGQWRGRLRELSEAHRPKKIEIYQNFVTEVFKILRQTKAVGVQPDGPSEQMIDFYFSFNRDLIAWGDPGVIHAWQKFKDGAQHRSECVMLYLDDTFRAIRADLGNSNRGVRRDDLVKLFLANPAEMDVALTKGC